MLGISGFLRTSVVLVGSFHFLLARKIIKNMRKYQGYMLWKSKTKKKVFRMIHVKDYLLLKGKNLVFGLSGYAWIFQGV